MPPARAHHTTSDSAMLTTGESEELLDQRAVDALEDYTKLALDGAHEIEHEKLPRAELPRAELRELGAMEQEYFLAALAIKKDLEDSVYTPTAHNSLECRLVELIPIRAIRQRPSSNIRTVINKKI